MIHDIVARYTALCSRTYVSPETAQEIVALEKEIGRMVEHQTRVAATHRALEQFHEYIRTPAGRRECERIRAARDRQAPITRDKRLIERACVAGELAVAEAIELARRIG